MLFDALFFGFISILPHFVIAFMIFEFIWIIPLRLEEEDYTFLSKEWGEEPLTWVLGRYTRIQRAQDSKIHNFLYFLASKIIGIDFENNIPIIELHPKIYHPDKNGGFYSLVNLFLKGIILILSVITLILVDIISFFYPSFFRNPKISISTVSILAYIIILFIFSIPLITIFFTVYEIRKMITDFKMQEYRKLAEELPKIRSDGTNLHLEYYKMNILLSKIEYLRDVPSFRLIHRLSVILTIVPPLIMSINIISNLFPIRNGLII